MVITSLELRQIDGAVDLLARTGLTRPWNDPREDLRRALSGSTSTVLAGLDATRLIATATVGHDGHRGWVYYLAVHPDAQGCGCGRAMMNACEAWLIERRVPKLNLMVRGDNLSARGFYESLSYGSEDVLVFSRRLVPP